MKIGARLIQYWYLIYKCKNEICFEKYLNNLFFGLFCQNSKLVTYLGDYLNFVGQNKKVDDFS